MKEVLLRSAAWSSLGFLIAVGGVAHAQTAPVAAPAPAAQDTSTQIDDIVVTAQRRAQSVQDTPLAISALSGESLKNSGVSDITQLGNALSNVNINQIGPLARISIRGIGNNATQPNVEAPVAYHVDGVFVSRAEAQADAFFDVSRVEVVRGPQGTLYGRNATGGAVNVITADPTDSLQGFADLTVGNFNLVRFEGAVSGPIAEGISGRLAVQSVNRDGYGHDGNGNGIEDANTRAIRGKLRFQPSEALDIILSAENFTENDSQGALNYIRPGDNPALINVGVKLGGQAAAEPRRNTNGTAPTITTKDDSAYSVTANLTLSDAATLTSITGYRTTDFYNQRDFDGTQVDAARFYSISKAAQFSQELRLGGDIGRFSYVLGGYYFHDDLDFTGRTWRNRAMLTAFTAPTPPPVGNDYVKGFYQYGTLKTDAYAAFGQASFEFNDWLGIDVGGRYSSETKDRTREAVANDNVTAGNPARSPFDPVNLPVVTVFAPESVRFTRFTPKVTLRAKPTEDIMLYATYSEGFRSGGYTLGSGGAAFLPELLTDYEAGIKADWFEHRLQTNLSLFYYDYTNLQVTRINPLGGPNIVESAGEAHLYGLEASVVAYPTDDLRLNLEVGLLRSEYDVFSSVDSDRPALGVQNLAGKTLVQAPEYTVNAGVEYTFHPTFGDVTVRAEGKFVDTTYFTPFNSPNYSQPAYAMYDLYVNHDINDSLSASVFVKNVTDELVMAALTGSPASVGAYVSGQAYPPRTFGLRLGYRF